ITVLRIKLFSEFTLNNLTESYIIILINRESDIITAVKRREREKNLLTADTVIISIKDVIERVKLLKLTDTAEFNLIFLIIMKAAAASHRHFFSINNTVRKTLLLSYK
ncbi:hypothetical protein EMPG_10036, partial [Blastomyces silverae]